MNEISILILSISAVLFTFLIRNWKYLSIVTRFDWPNFIFGLSLLLNVFLWSYFDFPFDLFPLFTGLVSLLGIASILSIIIVRNNYGKSKLWAWASIAILIIFVIFFMFTFILSAPKNVSNAKNPSKLENSSNSYPENIKPTISTPKENRYFDWDNIDLLGQDNIEITVSIDGDIYEGDNFNGEGSFYLPKRLKGKRCIVIFKNDRQEERISTKVGTALRLPKQLIALNPNDYLPRSKDDLGKLVHSIPDTMELKKWTTINIRITKDTQMVNTIDAKNRVSIAYNMTPSQVENLEIKDMTVGTEMQAKLEGLDNFEVKEITPSVQNIELNKNKYTEWIWEVKPLKEGDLPLIISISITKNINGQDLTKSIEVYRESISVFTVKSNRIWYGIVGSILLLFTGYFYWLRKRIKLKIQSLSAWVQASKDAPKSIFIGYAEEDQVWADKFYSHLLSLSKNGYVTIWYEKLMLAGNDRMDVIKNYLSTSDILLLIVSADFFASNDCDKLIEMSIKRHEMDNIQIVPIVVRRCHWELTALKQFTALPQNQKAISSEWNSSDEAIYQVIEELQMLIQYNAANNA